MGKDRYFLDVILKGRIPLKETAENISLRQVLSEQTKGNHEAGSVGLDIGFRKLAVVTEHKAVIYKFPEKDRGLEKKKRSLVQYMERSRRSMNPDNYLSGGRIRLGSSNWIYSRNYQKAKLEYGKICRKQAVLQKQEQYWLGREIISYRDRFFVDNLNFAKLSRTKPNGVYVVGTAPEELLRIL